MSSDDFLDDKRLKKLDKQLQELISRRGVERKTQDEVFDKKTLLTLGKFISDGVIDIVDFPISTGKEGNVFRGVTPDKKLVAVKIYRTSTSTFKHILKYIIGDPRFESIRKTRMDIVYAWTKKEFKNLERLKKTGVRAPKPIVYRKNVLVMEYIGDEEKPAPLLKDVTLDNPKDVFDEIVDFVVKMYRKAELVHGDISAFNILMHEEKPYLIDLGQGVLIEHPNAHDFLKRDIRNIVRYFKKFNIQADENKIYKKIINNKK
jgi:RIO kinase 1